MAQQVRPQTTNQLHHCVHLLINHHGLRGLSCQTGGCSHTEMTQRPQSLPLGRPQHLNRLQPQEQGNWVIRYQEMQKTYCHDKPKPIKTVEYGYLQIKHS